MSDHYSCNPYLTGEIVLMWIMIIGLAFLTGSLVEYWAHRLMHTFPRLGEHHIEHHRQGEGQGVLWEFLDYVKGGLIAMVLPFLFSWQVGLAWFSGAILYAAFSAYNHQLQHENPTKCFWMKIPVHYVHHKYNMGHHNFGLSVDWWDHVFCTYRPENCLIEQEQELSQRGYLELRWW